MKFAEGRAIGRQLPKKWSFHDGVANGSDQTRPRSFETDALDLEVHSDGDYLPMLVGYNHGYRRLASEFLVLVNMRPCSTKTKSTWKFCLS